MKPQKRHRLALRREILRQLTAAELAAGIGGYEEGASNAQCTRTCFGCEVGTTYTYGNTCTTT